MSVISESSGLQDTWHTYYFNGIFQLRVTLCVCHRTRTNIVTSALTRNSRNLGTILVRGAGRERDIVRDREAVALGVVLLAKAVLGVEQRRNSLRDRVFTFKMAKNISWNIFEFVSEDIRHVAELFERLEVIVFSHDVAVAFRESRGILSGVESINESTLAVSLLRDHKTELPTSDYANSFSHLLRLFGDS